MSEELKGPSIAGVRFQQAGRIYHFDAGDLSLELNGWVVVETKYGLSMGRVVIAPSQVIHHEIKESLQPVLRRATAEDMQRLEEAKQKEGSALTKCRELVAKLELSMKILKAEANFNGDRVIIFFTAPKKVDFRQLARELGTAVKVHIELRQVGARDAAKLTGGIGRCGYPLCCAAFLTDFAPLSIKMAKEQGLSLDPTKISGVCGRLLCCLGYENAIYQAGMQDTSP